MESSGRIIGGTETKPGNFSFMASLRVPEERRFIGGRHLCGGSLIAKNVVITAAHCLDSVSKPDVHIGRFEREGNDEGRFRAFKSIESVTHPSYRKVRRGVYSFDFALLVLDGESEAPPVDIRGKNVCSPDGSSCSYGTVLGWGRTIADNRRSLSDRLLKVDVPVVPRLECNTTYQSVDITNDMLCAGEVDKDSCSQDSGGPLLVQQCFLQLNYLNAHQNS
ncbi:hypothetical protein BSKO_09074 [Bryopsis sp. KO-2023]|nr:hypothetical protein BSKO_09074 [Bryopsis sp. KO-2023]